MKEKIMLNKIEQIKGYMYKKAIVLDEWQTREGIYIQPGQYKIEDEEWKTIKIGEEWVAKDDTTRWFKKTVVIPQDFDGQKVVLDIEVGGEGLVYINGEIRQGIVTYVQPRDEKRSRVLIAEKAKGGDTLEILIEAGLNYGEYAGYRARGIPFMKYTFRKALLAVVDPLVEKYYFDARVTYDALEVLRGSIYSMWLPREVVQALTLLRKDDVLSLKVLDALESSLAAVDIDFDRERLVSTLEEADKILMDKLNAIPYIPEATVLLVGHSHIDTAWLWPLKETVRKCARTFSNTVALMDEYPEHHFVQSQPQLYEYTKEYYPELYKKIKEKVAEGRWELIGNMWVESDTNVPSGESLVRQILYGRKFFQNEFGRFSRILWMPDVFGYSWALPQIIKRSGMEYFMTSKLLNNDTNKFPYTLFWWQGIDGTRILAYLQQVSYNGNINPRYINDAWARFNEKASFNEAMGTYGFGDGGGGPTYEMMEYSRRLKNFPGLPRTEISSAERFFDDARERAVDLPVWNNEMYYEFHRGTYTSQAKNKKNNRKSEFLYRDAEILSSLALQYGKSYPAEEIEYGWKKILLNQFHDILPGSSIHQVYEQCAEDYREILEKGSRIEKDALMAVVDNINTSGCKGIPLIVFNSLSWNRTDVVKAILEGDVVKQLSQRNDLVLVDEKGKEVAFELDRLGDEKAAIIFEAVDVPSMGYKVYELKAEAKTKEDDSLNGETAIKVSKNALENRFFEIQLDDDGNIRSIYDKTAKRQVLSPGGRGNVLQIFEDKPERESAWNIDLEYQKKSWEVNDVVSVEIVCSGPARGVLRIVKKFSSSTITQDIVIYNTIPRIDFETKVDWQETEKMLKAAFDVDVLSPEATYEIAYGNIKRPTHWNTSWDKARFEVPAHKWADLSEGGYGVSILNDCKYGYDIKDNVMRITLLRAPVYPDPVADKGYHEFVYSLYPHQGDWRQGDVVHRGYELNVPLKAVIARSTKEGPLPGSYSFLNLDKQNVVIEVLKRAEDGNGLILRVYESQGIRGDVTITCSIPLKKIVECNLMEEDERDVDACENSFTFYIKPYEIKTFRIL